MPRTAGARQVALRLAFCLSPVAVASAPTLVIATMPVPSSRPYLAAIAPPELRFGEPAAPVDLSVRLPAGAPPRPAGSGSPSERSAAPPLPASETAQPPSPTPVAAHEPEEPKTEPTETRPSNTKSAILPDDTRRSVKPEEFLPFFQFPGASPPPSTPPPSTATYRQQ